MMIGAEIAMFFIGAYALILGRMPGGSKGTREQVRLARTIGIVGLLPIPLSFLIGFIVSVSYIFMGNPIPAQSFRRVGVAIEGTIVGLCFVAYLLMARTYRATMAKQTEDGSA